MVNLQLSTPQLRGSVLLLAVFALPGGQAAAADLDQSLDVVSTTNSEAAKSQQKIDRLAGETTALLDEYRSLRNSTEYQAARARELQQLEDSQQQRLVELRAQIQRVGETQQRILPLMRSMADALEKFVVLDLPFQQQERLGAVLQLKQRLDRPELAMAARFRLLLEAWQIEQGYGSTIEAWRGNLLLEAGERSVEFLRIGRVALYYRYLNGGESGYWDKQSQNWEILPAEYDQAISRALQVARNHLAPELLTLPIPAPGDAS